MVGRGVVWASGLALGVAFVACGGRSTELSSGEGGEAGEESTGGKSSIGGRSAAGTGTGGASGTGVPIGGTAGTISIGGTSGGFDGGTGGASIPRGGTSGTGGKCSSEGSQGGWIGADGCAIPWWGTSLEGVKGLLECPAPDDPALLAFGQTNIPPCWAITGPVAEIHGSDGSFSCCYHYDERGCCGSNYEADSCIEIPFFGRGNNHPTLPTRPVEDPRLACEHLPGAVVELSRADAAERMIGIWLTCGETGSYFGDGIVFDGDGTFHILDLGDDLRLSEREGCGQGGLWGFYSDTGQVNLHVDDGTRYVFPTLAGPPNDRLFLDNVSFVPAIYASDL